MIGFNMFQKKDKYEVSFAIIYFLEQIALVTLTFKYPEMIKLFVSLFPIIFLTTIAIEKVCLKVNYEDEINKYKKEANKSKKIGIEEIGRWVTKK